MSGRGTDGMGFVMGVIFCSLAGIMLYMLWQLVLDLLGVL